MSNAKISDSKNRIEVMLTGTLFKDGNYWVAYSPELNVSSFGNTQKEAKAALNEALQLFLEDITERGTMYEALKELGWNISSDKITQSSVPIPSLESIKKFSNSFKLYEQATFLNLV